MINYRQKTGGQAMVELLIVAGLVLIPLFLAIPVLGKYLDIRSSAVQSARYAAWERTVWYGGAAATPLGFPEVPGFPGIDDWFGKKNVWLANEKDDTAVRNEIGVRLLSNTSQGFTSIDRSANGFKDGSKALWQFRDAASVAARDGSTRPMLASYDDVQNSIENKNAPGTLASVVSPIATFASILGSFTLEVKGAYAATVSIPIREFDTNIFQLGTNKLTFSETNVLLANGWNANGSGLDGSGGAKTSALQQVKGLVPTTIFDFKIGSVNVVDFILKVASIAVPEVSKLDPGKIEPDVVPPDRLK